MPLFPHHHDPDPSLWGALCAAGMLFVSLLRFVVEWWKGKL